MADGGDVPAAPVGGKTGINAGLVAEIHSQSARSRAGCLADSFFPISGAQAFQESRDPQKKAYRKRSRRYHKQIRPVQVKPDSGKTQGTSVIGERLLTIKSGNAVGGPAGTEVG